MLATSVPVTNAPDQRWPRRTSSEEKRIARMRGGALLGSTRGVGSLATPIVTFDGTSVGRDAQPASSTATQNAPTRGSTFAVVRNSPGCHLLGKAPCARQRK